MSDKPLSDLQVIFSHLHALFRTVGFYTRDHAQTQRAREELFQALESHLASEEQLVFRVLDDLLVANERPLPHESLVFRRFLLTCQDRQHIGSITFLRGVERRELDVLIEALTAAGAQVVAYDPVALDNARKLLAGNGKVSFASSARAASEGADVLAVVTEWLEFRSPDFEWLAGALRDKALFDGRNLYDAVQVRKAGLRYRGIGRGAT